MNVDITKRCNWAGCRGQRKRGGCRGKAEPQPSSSAQSKDNMDNIMRWGQTPTHKIIWDYISSEYEKYSNLLMLYNVWLCCT